MNYVVKGAALMYLFFFGNEKLDTTREMIQKQGTGLFKHIYEEFYHGL
jgi:hypothetical protein